MKNIFHKTIAVAFLALLFNGTVTAQSKITKPLNIKGKVAILNPDFFKKYNMVWLYQGIGTAKKTIDSVPVNADGSFAMVVKSPGNSIYSMNILKWQTATFWSDQDVYINARGYDTAKVKGQTSPHVAVESKSAITNLINAANHNLFTIVGQKEIVRLKSLITTNQGNPGLVYLLSLLTDDKEANFFEENLNKLLAAQPQLRDAKQLKKDYLDKVALRNSLKAGSIVPNIAYNDPAGKAIDIKSFRGKYVLIDFWASWCGPCRRAIPIVKELYAKYHDKGFDVLSISIDKDNNAWRKAMAEEGMPWPQVLSPNMDKTVADFMLQGIPTLFLIDRDGKIVDKYIGLTDQSKIKLEEVLKNKL